MISAECVVRWCSCSRRSSWWGPSVARCGCVTAKPSHRPRKWRLHSTLTSDPSTLSREIRSFLRTSCQLATGALEWASFTPRLIHEPVTPLDAYLNPSFSSPLSPSIIAVVLSYCIVSYRMISLWYQPSPSRSEQPGCRMSVMAARKEKRQHGINMLMTK